MTSSEIRQSFFDFFASKAHAIVPSASLLPTAPNLLFTNAGMNQFVPYFLGERDAPSPRIADTQKCIRAGGKHNDLDDVGYDAYHQTFFEMLGNWSFGDYFKEEALTWSWELLTEVWKMPPNRLYATVYQPGEGDPSDFDSEAYAIWEGIFTKAGLDPKKHIIYGGKKDNFWMMGDTGPCGPCSEIHIDLTAENTGTLVNADSPWCIELWNNVFIQFNATPDGQFLPLKNKHVDTGMGFERIAGIFATTKNFTDFSRPPSNYDADLFTGIFGQIESLCGQKYGATLPEIGTHPSADEMRDIAFRVLADHARCLTASIADGILPGNEGRNYVLRRILRRAVMYGRKLNLEPGFFTTLVDPVIKILGSTFPEMEERADLIRKVIRSEEDAFDRTLDRGIAEFEKMKESLPESAKTLSGENAFLLYDTYGFPLDLTVLLAKEAKLEIDLPAFEKAMEAQRERARASQKKTIVTVVDDQGTEGKTEFTGFDRAQWKTFKTTVVDLVENEGHHFLITKETPFYAEMGGQVGDQGELKFNNEGIEVVDTTKDTSGRFLHHLGKLSSTQAKGLTPGTSVELSVDRSLRLEIQRHHSATHILHWALRKTLGTHVQQAGSFVGPDRLRFDFTHFEAISSKDLIQIEDLCNSKILENDPIRWYEVPFEEKPEEVIAFFGEKYGNVVRVVDIGGWSKELCGGAHAEATGELGLLKIVSESAIASGTRRIEAVSGRSAHRFVQERNETVDTLAKSFSSKPEEVVLRAKELQDRYHEAEKSLKSLKGQVAAIQANSLQDSASKVGDLEVLAVTLKAENPNDLRQQAVQIHRKLTHGLLVAGAIFEDKVSVLAMASPEAIEGGFKAGDIIRALTAKLGGKGGGKPDFAMGGGNQPDALASTLKSWQESLSNE